MALTRDWRYVVAVVTGGHALSHFYLLAFPPVLPQLRAAFELSNTEFGLLMSVIALWSFVVEALFHIPGITAYAQIAVRLRDLPLLVGTAAVLALVGVGLGLAQDLLYGYLDPET